MSRLKSREKFPPGGFSFLEASTGWQPPAWASFDTIVRGVIGHRTGNPFNTRKLKLATDYPTVANEVDLWNARVAEAKGYTDFILTEATSFPPSSPPPLRSRPRAAGGGNLKRTAAGIKVMVDWLGSGLKPVAPELAEKRAAVCVVCPLNQSEEGFFATLTAAAMAQVKSLIEIKNELELKTSVDSQLLACMACGCSNKLKPWVAIEHILKGQTEEVKSKLDPACWVLSESK